MTSVQNCKIWNSIITAQILLSNPAISGEVVRLSNEIQSLNAKLATTRDKAFIDMLTSQIDDYQLDIQALVMASVLKWDFGVPQRQALVKSLKRRWTHYQKLIDIIDSFDRNMANFSNDEMQQIAKSIWVWEDVLEVYWANVSKIKDTIINRLAEDVKFNK